jgi:hypothetical protein
LHLENKIIAINILAAPVLCYSFVTVRWWRKVVKKKDKKNKKASNYWGNLPSKGRRWTVHQKTKWWTWISRTGVHI